MNVVTALRFALLIWIGSLFALLGVQRFLIDPTPSLLATFAVFAVQVAPLLAVTATTLRGGSRGPLLLCLIVPLYFVHGVWQWSMPSAHGFGVAEVVFALGAFITAWLLLKVMPAAASR